MRYREFKEKYNLLEILFLLNILKTSKELVEINLEPDYDISNYKREIGSDYYFNNSWDFSSHYRYLISVDISAPVIYHSESISQIEGGNFSGGSPFERVKKISLLPDNELEGIAMEANLDEFIINIFRFHSIDNNEKQFYYEGSFFGDSIHIDPIDWVVVSTFELVGIHVDNNPENFYKSILAESFVVFEQGNYKLSYFLLYTSLESFINTKVINEKIAENCFEKLWNKIKPKDKKNRFSERLSLLFKQKFENINSHKIYSSVLSEFSEFTKDRNCIAHGVEDISIDKQKVTDKMYMVLTLICSYEYNCKTFTELKNKID